MGGYDGGYDGSYDGSYETGAIKRFYSACALKVFTAHVPLPWAEKLDRLAARIARSRGGSRGWGKRLGQEAGFQAGVISLDSAEKQRYQLRVDALADVDAFALLSLGLSYRGRIVWILISHSLCRILGNNGTEMDKQSCF